MSEFAEVYQENKGSIKPLINLHYELDARCLTVRDVVEQLKTRTSIRELEARQQAIQKYIEIEQYRLEELRQQRQYAEKQLGDIQYANRAEQQTNLSLRADNQFFREANERCKSALDVTMSSRDYGKIQAIARSEITAILDTKSVLVSTAAASVVKANWVPLIRMIGNWKEIISKVVTVMQYAPAYSC